MAKSKFVQSIFPNLSPIKKIGKLRCPDCNKPMFPFACQDVVVDKCLQCNGIWFDHQEFGVFKRTLDTFDLTRINEIYRPSDSETIVISLCPHCGIPLFEINFSYKSGVKIRKCERCSGLWLPIHQSLNLIELAKISQAIAPDVKAVAAEMKKHQEEMQKSKEMKEFAKDLKRPQSSWYYSRYIFGVLPLYDENPRTLFPYSTVALIVINIVVFLAMAFSGIPFLQWFDDFALKPGDIGFGGSSTLFTSMFMHGGINHLLGNMYFLWLFGDNVEEKIGSVLYLLFYLTCGLFAGFGQILSAPNSMIPVVGASGAISGVLGAYLVFFPQVKIKTAFMGNIIDVPTWVYLGVWVFFQLLWASVYSGSDGGGVAWWAHLGGFGTGFLISYSYRIVYPKKQTAD